ncbi:MAG: hypothetical protein H7Y04_07820 [Verrucomicrobia bacterium]|nr:hypothetical protein [Cytophagales bacterium]
MDTHAMLSKILKATKPEEIFTQLDFKKEYLSYQKIFHPDVCHLPEANEAVKKLNSFRDQMEESNKIKDDAGTIEQATEKKLVFRGDKDLLLKSMENFQKLIRLNDDSAKHFRKYLPQAMEYREETLYVFMEEKAVPVYNLTLPQEHITWFTSRMFEFTAWLHQVGYCHAGINPASVSIVPETHGVVFTSFYHLQPLHSQLKTISAKYLDWYPDLVFKNKQAIAYIDLNLVQRTALYVLGDKSGNGIRLKKDNNEFLIDFLITPHYEAYKTFDEYRNLLRSLFGKPKFHKLEL